MYIYTQTIQHALFIANALGTAIYSTVHKYVIQIIPWVSLYFCVYARVTLYMIFIWAENKSYEEISQNPDNSTLKLLTVSNPSSDERVMGQAYVNFTKTQVDE